MIKLDVDEYCHGCAEFEPVVTERPKLTKVSFERFRFCDNTIVECRYRNRCEAIYNYLKEKNDD